MNQSWYSPLKNISSLGSTSTKPGSLAGIHAARETHLSQFFTPDDLVKLIWNIASPLINSAYNDKKRLISILDNSVGSGRMFQYANPEQCFIAGIDVHQDSINALMSTAQEAGFHSEFVCASMQDAEPKNFDFAFINPPFSIHLESPNLQPFACTTWGKFGKNTSAISHAYALYQAMNAAEIVFAVLPKSYATEVINDKEVKSRLHATIHLPKDTFEIENAKVETTLLIIGNEYKKPNPITLRLKSLQDDIPSIGIELYKWSHGRPRLDVVDGYIDNEPSITIPVTGEKTVRLEQNGRYIVPIYSCGLTQTKVMNAILGSSIKSQPIENHRYAKSVKYMGQGILDIEVHLLQQDPHASFQSLLDIIKKAGGIPDVSSTLSNYFAKRVRQHIIRSTPYRHTVFTQDIDQSSFDGLSKQTFALDPKKWGSPIIKAGQKVEFRKESTGVYTLLAADNIYKFTQDELVKKFELDLQSNAGWKTVHAGRVEAFPNLAKPIYKKAEKLGINKWLSWDYQLYDLVEISIAPGDTILAYDMGLGKARMAISLIMLSGCKHGLISVESQLVDEMLKELTALDVDKSIYQVIKGPKDLINLKQINIISYERLRMPINRAHLRRTYASELRHRIGVMVSDEGHLLRKRDTEQSKSVWMVSAKRKYILTGTPAANYPRDVHQLLVYEGGDGTAAQPYGDEKNYLEARLIDSMYASKRGTDAFRDDFIVTEWCTNEFKEDNTNGAKREVPKIANLSKYRAALSCHVKRRVSQEPEVAAHIKIPVPTKKVTTVSWDNKHLNHYLEVGEEFITWYNNAHKDAGRRGVRMNLVAVLARIQALEFACNLPQRGHNHFKYFGRLTSKQKYAISRVQQLIKQGKKIILYAENPELLQLLHAELAKHNIDALLFHGGININKRTKLLDQQFRFGNKCQVMLASLGVTQNGLNIPQANYVLFYDRAWDCTTENQAGARVLRPQQLSDVDFEYLHIEGSIDEYKAQMVAHKQDSIHAGVDWATPELSTVEFLHLDTLLGRFVNDLTKKLKLTRTQLKEAIAA